MRSMGGIDDIDICFTIVSWPRVVGLQGGRVVWCEGVTWSILPPPPHRFLMWGRWALGLLCAI